MSQENGALPRYISETKDAPFSNRTVTNKGTYFAVILWMFCTDPKFKYEN
jgi:hypothetical protein